MSALVGGGYAYVSRVLACGGVYVCACVCAGARVGVMCGLGCKRRNPRACILVLHLADGCGVVWRDGATFLWEFRSKLSLVVLVSVFWLEPD